MDNLLTNPNDSQESIDSDVQGAVDLAISICKTTPFRKKQIKSSNNNYQVLTPDEIVQYVVECVQEVNSVIQLTPTVTRMLLSHCKWDKHLLMEKFYQDPEKLFKDARVINPFNVLISADDESENNNECEICYAELSSRSTAKNACGHRFCTSCWSEYLKVKIMDNSVGNSILCAKTDCDIVIDDETVTELVGDSEARRRYQHIITNSYVQRNLLLRWCPAAGCSFAIKVDYSPLKPISCHCKCGHVFCFDCAEQWHEPAPCEILRRFSKHLADGFFHVLMDHMNIPVDNRIKTCPNPNCTVSIQKIFGCHVMQCKNCSTIFCWECLDRFKTRTAVYAHPCKGDTSSGTVNLTEATAHQEIDVEEELAPPRKFLKIGLGVTVATQKRREELPLKEAPVNDIERHTDQGTVEKGNRTVRWLHQRNNERRQQREAMGFHERFRAYDYLRLPDRAPNAAFHMGMGQNIHYNKYNKEDALLKAAIAHCDHIKQVLRFRCNDTTLSNLTQLESAANFLVQSHQTLKYAALFAMFLRKLDGVMLFKNLLLDYEAAVTELSHSIGLVNVHDTASHALIPGWINPSYRICQLRRRALLDYIDEGYDNEWWLFEDVPNAQ